MDISLLWGLGKLSLLTSSLHPSQCGGHGPEHDPRASSIQSPGQSCGDGDTVMLQLVVRLGPSWWCSSLLLEGHKPHPDTLLLWGSVFWSQTHTSLPALCTHTQDFASTLSTIEYSNARVHTVLPYRFLILCLSLIFFGQGWQALRLWSAIEPCWSVNSPWSTVIIHNTCSSNY